MTTLSIILLIIIGILLIDLVATHTETRKRAEHKERLYNDRLFDVDNRYKVKLSEARDEINLMVHTLRHMRESYNNIRKEKLQDEREAWLSELEKEWNKICTYTESTKQQNKEANK